MTSLTSLERPNRIEPLLLEHVSELPISWRSRLDAAEIRQKLRMTPGISVWNPDTYEYAIAAPWRNRREIVQVADLAAIRHPEDMVRGVAEAAASQGIALTVVVEIDEQRPASFYLRSGYEHLERVVTFRIDTRLAPSVPRMAGLRFELVHPFDDRVLSELLTIDHAAFPWLWWNSEAEFLHYSVSHGVQIMLGYDGDDPVSYIGMTVADEWGHIDRIAVHPSRHGGGYGLQTMSAAVELMVRYGVRTLGLSTQSTNERSQRLYQRFGFERTRDSDYDLWGDTRFRARHLNLHATAESTP
jgi:ribosomal protein S18 acetylase RimI-like enzyme